MIAVLELVGAVCIGAGIPVVGWAWCWPTLHWGWTRLESLRANDERMRQVVEDAERDAAEARRLLGEAVGPL